MARARPNRGFDVMLTARQNVGGGGAVGSPVPASPRVLVAELDRQVYMPMYSPASRPAARVADENDTAARPSSAPMRRPVSGSRSPIPGGLDLGSIVGSTPFGAGVPSPRPGTSSGRPLSPQRVIGTPLGAGVGAGAGAGWGTSRGGTPVTPMGLAPKLSLLHLSKPGTPTGASPGSPGVGGSVFAAGLDRCVRRLGPVRACHG
jgi:hypothetical protein